MPEQNLEVQADRLPAAAEQNGDQFITLISTAMNREGGIDADALDKLLAARERYEAAEARRAFHAAMSEFRKVAPVVSKTGKVVVSKSGATASYARLSDAVRDIRPLLAELGLNYRWETKQENNSITVACIATHRAGHSERTELSAAPDTSGSKNSVQAIGSTVAYLERYTLFAMFGLSSADMDDDAAGATAGPRGLITDEQLADLVALLDEIPDMPRDDFKKYLEDRHGVPEGKLQSIPAGKYRAIVATLEKRRKNGKPQGVQQ